MFAYLKALNNYANFTGRASRGECWSFLLFSALVYGGFCLLDQALGTYWPKFNTGLLALSFALASLIPAAAVLARRLRDADCNTRYLWWLALPALGVLIVMVLALLPSEPAAGEDKQNCPKERELSCEP